MSYFVTGATGFIGRNLVELLLEREGTIYVLVREGSKGRLEAAQPLGDGRLAGRGHRRRPVRAAPRHLRCGPRAAEGRDRPSLPPRRDLRHDRRRGVAAGRERRGHPPHGRVRRGRGGGPGAHGEPIAAAGLYRGTWREDMFDEAQDLDTHAYFRTKHEVRRASSARSASGRGASTGRASSSATRRPARWTRSTVPTTSSS